MPSIALEVEKTIRSRPYVLEALGSGIASFAGLASRLLPEIERRTGRKVNKAAIVMALRRIKVKAPVAHEILSLYSDSVMRTGLVRITAKHSFQTDVGKVVEFFQNKKAETFNIIYTESKSVIYCKSAHKNLVQKLLKKERLLGVDGGVASITVNFSARLSDLGGVLFYLNSALYSRGIGIIDHIFGLDKLTLFVPEKDMAESYSIIEEILRGER